VINYFRVKSGIVVNKYDLNKELTEKIKKIAQQYNSEFVGIIPYGKEVTQAQIKKLSVVEYADTPLTDSIKDIWAKIGKIFHD
jgi:MinD superfamily P-loop ATPase